MTAAIAQAELIPELPSRRLRLESESGQAPALLCAIAAVGVLLGLAGIVPRPVALSQIAEEVGAEIELLNEPGRRIPPPPGSAKELVIVDNHTPALPVHDSIAPVEVSEQAQSVAETGDRMPGPDLGAGGAGTNLGDGAATPDQLAEPGRPVFVDEMPSVRMSFAPDYPSLARDAGVEGKVLLWALVGVDGVVQEVRVQRSIPMLDEAATEAVMRWRFKPAWSNGHAVRVWVAIPVLFRVRS